MILSSIRIAAIAGVAITTPALAHPGHGEAGGFASGILHPFQGIDHLLTMILVGAWSARCYRAHVWRVPALFVLCMLAGFLIALADITIPAEPIILASILVCGALLLIGQRLPFPAAALIVALFGIAHGYVHGNENMGPQLPFAAGMLLATATAHAIGILCIAGPPAIRRLIQAAQSLLNDPRKSDDFHTKRERSGPTK